MKAGKNACPTKLMYPRFSIALDRPAISDSDTRPR
jgi:hypothetical protein